MTPRRDEKDDIIYRASLKLFAHYGYRKTTIDDIAREVGMTRSNLYFYVSDKRDLYEKTVSRAFLEWQSDVAKAVEREKDPVGKFRVMALRSIEYLEHHEELRSIFVNDPGIFSLSPSEDRFYGINLGAIRLIEDILRDGIDQGVFHDVDIEHTSQLFFSIYVMFLIKTYVKSEGISAMRMYKEGLEIILRGLSRH